MILPITPATAWNFNVKFAYLFSASVLYYNYTQPGHPSLDKRNDYWPMGGEALRLGVKADMVVFAGNTV